MFTEQGIQTIIGMLKVKPVPWSSFNSLDIFGIVSETKYFLVANS